jgi:hypothetical protein
MWIPSTRRSELAESSDDEGFESGRKGHKMCRGRGQKKTHLQLRGNDAQRPLLELVHLLVFLSGDAP